MNATNEKLSNSFYRPELDVLRFFAFLIVFLLHGASVRSGLASSIQNACAFGVCIFYLLSSYLITELLEREYQQTGHIRLSAFYMRRILRIWPLYFAVLFLDYFIHHTIVPGDFSLGRLVSSVLLAGNWYVAHHGFSMTISSPLWSISVEEQFYLLWPSVRRFFGRKTAVVFSLLTLFVACAVTEMHPVISPHNLRGIWVNSFVQFQFFGAGALIALWLRGRRPAISASVRAILFVLGCTLFVTAQHWFHIMQSTVPVTSHMVTIGYLMVNMGCCMLFFGFLGSRRAGSLSTFVYLGKISYGLYVFHWGSLQIFSRLDQWLFPTYMNSLFIRNCASLIPALILTVVCSSLSYHFFESPILRLKRRFEVVHTRPIRSVPQVFIPAAD